MKIFKFLIVNFIYLNFNYANAQLKCVNLFGSNFNQFLISKVEKSNQISGGFVEINNKKIPVILVNNQDIQQIKPLLNKSLGIVVAHQTGYRNDHGLLRIGNYFIDRDTPGARARNELNKTGISWASVEEYVNYSFKHQSIYNRIEVLFELNEAELKTAYTYQLIRQAALMRPNFIFGGDTNPKNVTNVLNNYNCGEICFSFSTGSVIENHVKEMNDKIKQFGINDPEIFIKNEKLDLYFKLVQDFIFNTPFTNDSLNPLILTKIEIPDLIKNLKFEPQKMNELLNWIVSYKFSLDYSNLLKNLKIENSNNFSNLNSEKATAVLIYDSRVSENEFESENYISTGVFSVWKNYKFSKD